MYYESKAIKLTLKIHMCILLNVNYTSIFKNLGNYFK